ncbi:hypothetical protein ACWDUH_27195 [Micromonospora wenchangensis]
MIFTGYNAWSRVMLVEPRGLEPLTPALQRRIELTNGTRPLRLGAVGFFCIGTERRRLSTLFKDHADFSLTCGENMDTALGAFVTIAPV